MIDVRRAAALYEQLGLDISYHDESYAFAHRDRDPTLHLARKGSTSPGHGSLYIHCQDADRVAEEWRLAGISVEQLLDLDYGKREGFVIDPDGNSIRFGSPLPRIEITAPVQRIYEVVTDITSIGARGALSATDASGLTA